MYASGSKCDGHIVGLIGKGNVALDMSDVADNTSAEESLMGLDDDGNIVAMIAVLGIKPPHTGEVVWNISYDIESTYRRTVSMSQMTSMLRDNDRNRIYEEAVTICIKNYKNISGKDPHVLDIGTGTGLLACIAAEEGAKAVTACEMFVPMAQIAQDIIHENHFDSIVDVVNAKSTDIDSGPIHDIIISELLDSALLGESVLPSHYDAIARLFNKNESIPIEDCVVPHSASVYISCIESLEMKKTCNVPSLSDDWSPYRNEYAKECEGGWLPIPIHWNELRDGRRLSEDILGTDINFFFDPRDIRGNDSSEAHMPVEIPLRKSKIAIPITCAGTLNGFMMTWDLHLLSKTLDPERAVMYSTRPGKQNWQDHWLQMIFPLKDGISVMPGDVIHLDVYHDSIKIWLKVHQIDHITSSTVTGKRPRESSNDLQQLDNNMSTSIDDSDDSMEPPTCSCGWHILHGAERFMTLNDKYLQTTWSKAMDCVVNMIDDIMHQSNGALIESHGTIVPVIFNTSDGSELALRLQAILKRHNPCKQNIAIVSKETKQFSNLFYSQLTDANAREDATNDIIVWDGNSRSELIDMIIGPDDAEGDDSADISQENSQENVTIQIIGLLSECFLYQLHAQPIRQALSFHYQRSNLLDSIQSMLAPIYTNNPFIFPAAARIMIAPFELTNLNKAHGPVSK